MSEDHNLKYEELEYTDPEFQERLRLQKKHFGYGLMSMDDVKLTNDTTDPEQDERDVKGTLALLFGKRK